MSHREITAFISFAFVIIAAQLIIAINQMRGELRKHASRWVEVQSLTCSLYDASRMWFNSGEFQVQIPTYSCQTVDTESFKLIWWPFFMVRKGRGLSLYSSSCSFLSVRPLGYILLYYPQLFCCINFPWDAPWPWFEWTFTSPPVYLTYAVPTGPDLIKKLLSWQNVLYVTLDVCEKLILVVNFQGWHTLEERTATEELPPPGWPIKSICEGIFWVVNWCKRA